MLKLLSAASGVLVLIGCASLSYVGPTSGERARVRIVTDTEAVSVLRTYEGPDCSGAEEEWMRLRVGPLLTGSLTRLGMPLWNFHQNAAKEVYVSALKPFSAIFWGTGFDHLNGRLIHQQCGVPIAMSFDSSKDYEVQYHWHPLTCSVSVYEIRADSKTYERHLVEQFSNRATNANSQCLAQFKRFRLD